MGTLRQHGNYDPTRRWGCIGTALYSATVIAIVVILLLCSCSRTEYVPVERVRTEYRQADTTAIYNRLLARLESERRMESSTDSIVDRRKETVTLNDSGDTVRVVDTRYVYVSSRRERELEREVSERDSIIGVLRTQLSTMAADSIPVPYPVERELSRWERIKMTIGDLVAGLWAILAVLSVMSCVIKFRETNRKKQI